MKYFAGVQKLETEISGFLDPKGVAGSWGTNQPEKGKQIFENVGLGIYMPNKYIKDFREDVGNYLFNIEMMEKNLFIIILLFVIKEKK